MNDFENGQVRGSGVVLHLLLSLVLLAFACSTSGENADGDPGLSHVHGLGVNPADGKLYAASHQGVFRIDGESAVRQGVFQDTMGFTVVGSDRFLASGHPDPKNSAPLKPGMQPLLGLIESTDKGISC